VLDLAHGKLMGGFTFMAYPTNYGISGAMLAEGECVNAFPVLNKPDNRIITCCGRKDRRPRQGRHILRWSQSDFGLAVYREHEWSPGFQPHSLDITGRAV